MDSEDSRPGSSASNSSSNSSENSFQSSGTHTNEDENRKGNKSPDGPERSPSPTENRPSRPRTRSRSSNEDARSARSLSKSDSNSSSSSSSSDSENEDDKSPSAAAVKSKSSSRRGSNEFTPEKQQSSNAENRLSSPNKSQHSSRNSSTSSNRSRSRSRSNSPANSQQNGGVNISHEDLSDVSDMESEKRASVFNNSKQSLEDEGTNASSVTGTLLGDEEEENIVPRRYSLEADNSQNAVITDLRQKLDQKKSQGKAAEMKKDKEEMRNSNNDNEHLEVLVKTNDEDALDFEAEEGECQDISKEEEQQIAENNANAEKAQKSGKSDGETDEGELEEGEVSDEDEKRPEETEPKPVCRFYTRGQCTWGMSCRFLHPGVTDKGNYTMFDLVRPVPVPTNSVVGSRAPGYVPHVPDYHDYRNERPALHHRVSIPHVAPVYGIERPLAPEGPVVVESAWERGLRTAKEMMRKANKRKEQDMDFEDKKMNLTLSPDEIEKDAYYLKDRGSPADVVPPYSRHPAYQEPVSSMYIPDRYSRAPPPVPAGYDDIDPYGRSTRYRELPPHRMPQYEDERRVRPTREVIVQRVETGGRGDEWRDPWMRSPGGRGESRDHDKRRRDRRSYSSNSSYSSSSSSQSDSSSDSSRSATPADHRRRYNSSHKSPPPIRRHGRSGRSPSPVPRRSRHSPVLRHSPNAKRRGHTSASPAVDKRSSYSPVHKRKKLSPSLKKSLNDKSKGKRRLTSSSSGSGSSDSSVSDSDSDTGSSSSDSSSRSRERTSVKRSRTTQMAAADRKIVKKDPPKKRSPISIEIKKQQTVGTSALASSPTHSVTSDKDSKKSRREELLKQLRAVEDAIAKKRSKLA